MVAPGAQRIRVLAAGVLVAAGLAGAAGCASAGHDANGNAGAPTASDTVHGVIVQVGGPSGAEPGHPAGTVTVTRAGRQVAEQRVPEGGEFRFTLNPGSYRLSVTGVDGGCAPVEVTVLTGGTDQAVELTCQRK